MLPEYIKGRYCLKEAYEIFSEYYTLKANDFNKYAINPIELWMHFLSHSELTENADTSALQEAAQQLREDYLPPEERADYFSYLDGLKSISAAINTALYLDHLEGLELGRLEDLEQGREQGLAEGREKGREEGIEESLQQGKEQGNGKWPRICIRMRCHLRRSLLIPAYYCLTSAVISN